MKLIYKISFILTLLNGCVNIDEKPYLIKDVQSTNLIKNGSFELPALGKHQWDIFQSIPEWSLSFGAGIEVQNHVAGSPSEGLQFVELSSRNNSGIYQDIATIPENKYLLQFAFSFRPRTSMADNKLEVLWDGLRIDTLSANGSGKTNTNWKIYSYEVIAKSNLTRLKFNDVSEPSSLGTYIDAVRLIPIKTQYINKNDDWLSSDNI